RFSIVERSEIKDLINEGDQRNSSLAGPVTPPEQGKFKAKYLLVTTLDSVDDYSERLIFAPGREAVKRRLRLSALTKIYDGTTRELLNSSYIEVRNKDVAEINAGLQTDDNH